MHVISFTSLRRFGEVHPDAMPPLRRWLLLTRSAAWHTMDDVLLEFGSAKLLTDGRVRFAIHGGAYRLIVAFDFRQQVAYVKFVGSHAQYDRIDALTVSQL